MAEELPSLHIDTDWKTQAREEKRKLAEAAEAAKAKAAAPAPAGIVAPPSAGAPAAKPARRPRGEAPVPGFASLVQSVLTQVLYYLGDLAASTGQQTLDLDMAKYHLDTLSMLEEKTKNNLTGEEQGLLDAALYETRSRFVSVASQMLGP